MATFVNRFKVSWLSYKEKNNQNQLYIHCPYEVQVIPYSSPCSETESVLSTWPLISCFGINCFYVVVTGDSGACPFILVPSSFGGILCLKHYALRLHVMFSNNLKHFKKYRIMHSHHFKLYNKETNGKKERQSEIMRKPQDSMDYGFFCTSDIYFAI